VVKGKGQFLLNRRKNMYLHTLKIGNVELENNIILAPMAGITDLPFRIVCKSFGPGLVCTEMVSSRGIEHNDYKTKKMLKTLNEKRPVSMQIFGSDIKSMATAAKEVSKYADILDINMGCPAPKVVKNGDGSKLLLNLELAGKIIEEVVKNSDVPVTVKFRAGWDDSHIVATDLAKIAQSAGASAISIHGRTREQFYTGTVDKEIIKKVKESVDIPVIASGDIIDEQTALEMFEYTGVDGIMIGRAAIGNPWIFKKIIHFLETGEKLQEPTNQEKLEVIKEHINLTIIEKGETVAIKEMRKHYAHYTKNMKDSASFRNKINLLDTKQEVFEALDEYFNKI
jgi:tRNA-dihydrouridine synthase B